MKIIIAGAFISQIHEYAIYNGFKKIGYNPIKFEWGSYYKTNGKNFIINFLIRFQGKFLVGPLINRLNMDLLKKCIVEKPNLLFIYRGNIIKRSTIIKIRKAGIIIFGYNNDDPFSSQYKKYNWRHFIKSIFYYDHVFSYRNKNLLDYKNIGYYKTSILMPYYIKERNFPIQSYENIEDYKKYNSDVTFIGHFEEDGRDDIFKKLILDGYNIKIYGPEWHRSKHINFFKTKIGDIVALNEDYNLCINSSKILIVLLSSLNNDNYTRRCFEIPAAEGFMLSTYTKELDNIFPEGVCAEYFRSYNELTKKIDFYLKEDSLRKKIALSGRKVIIEGKFEVMDRVNQIIKTYEEVKNC